MTWSPVELVERLRTLDETVRIEAKKGVGNSVRETVSAFANEPDLGGGWVVFGVVRDSSGTYRVVGVSDPDTVQADLATQCRDQFNRALRPDIRVAEVESRTVVAAFVPEADPRDKPVYVRSVGLPRGAFRRIGSTDQRFTDEDLAQIAALSSRTPFDQRAVDGATVDDLSPDAIRAAREEFRVAQPASELHGASDSEFLRAIGALVPGGDGLTPSVAGIVLFGAPLALRRLMPAMRVDYIRVRGTQWQGESGDDYTTLEIREPLVIGWKKVFATITDDLPVSFRLPAGSAQRRHLPRVPERVVREALVNALAHRNYEINGSIQIRRFANRLEIENPGYSLVPEEQWGEPVSRPRNPSVIDVFRDLGLAESKGTGIRRMRERMQESGLSMPIFESHREANRFVVTLLFQHFLDDADLKWLGHVGTQDDVEAQILVRARDNGRITNREARALSGDDTLATSARLRRLRDRGLLEQRGESKQETYYCLTELAGGPPATATAGDAGEEGDHDGDLGSQSGDLIAQPGNLIAQPGNLDGPLDTRAQLLERLPQGLRERIEGLPGKADRPTLQALTIALCSVRAQTPVELGVLLRRNPSYLKDTVLRPLVRERRLELVFPESKHHPRQAYRAAAQGDGRDR
jgi:ATP-dependent DNA helicase RecG